MPELPEVETVRKGLSSAWIGKRIDGVELRREGLRFPFPEDLESRLVGRKVTDVRRRAKYLLIDLDNEDILLSHLGMSGSWTLDASSGEEKHDHVVISPTSSKSMTRKEKNVSVEGPLKDWSKEGALHFGVNLVRSDQ